MPVVALLRVRIPLPSEARVPLAIAGGLLLALILLAWFNARFGRKGLIVLGSVLGVGLLGFGGLAFSKWKSNRDWVLQRSEDAEERLALVRAALREPPGADGDVAASCSNPPLLDAKVSSPKITLVRPLDDDAFVLSEHDRSTYGSKKLRVGPEVNLDEGIYGLEYGLEGALQSKVFLIVTHVEPGRAAVTAIRPDDGKRCSGTTALPPGELDGDALVSRVARSAGWTFR